MISIITACYNDNEIVKRAIQTALQQNIPGGELILVDDGSKVPLQNLWGNQVKLIRHLQNRGLSAALNTGIKAAKNDHYVILSADDMFRSDWAQVMLPHLGKADIISCDFQGERGKVVNCKPGSLKELKLSNCHSYSAIVKKSLWEKVGGYKEYMNPSWEDWEFWLNCAKNGATWHHVPQAVHLYHRNPKGRDVDSQDKELLLRAKFEGAHQDLFGKGRGLVTFIIPCYNQEKFVLDALQSIYDQRYPHVRAVIVDDGSPGDILPVLKKAPSIKDLALIRQKNKGLSAARNKGIQYAIENLKSQYLVMLDADDKVHPDFVEECLKLIQPKHYIYTDVEFFGSGSGQLILDDFNCKELAARHLHACTFLAEADLWRDIALRRGFAYDENMQKGYEDWEFAAASVESGYCGKRLPKSLFYYRQHAEGSMRVAATKINNELARYITSKHTWMRGGSIMPCSSCGQARSVGRLVMNRNGGSKMYVNVPGVGEVDATSLVTVTYHGERTDTQLKVGRGLPGRGSASYRFNNQECREGGGICKSVNIFAVDHSLFIGPFTFKKYEPVSKKQEAVVEIQSPKKTELVFEKATVVAEEPDDLSALKHIGPAKQKRLNEVGITHFHQLTLENLQKVLNFSVEKSQEVLEDVKGFSSEKV